MMKKINIIGTSGSGKTTFSRQLASLLNYPCIEMDQVYWGKNWSEPDDATFFAALEARLKCDNWVLDGNYTRSIPIKWKDVDTIIWIDFSFTRTVFQAVKRAITRIVSQQELWPNTGNRESVKKLFSRDSIVLWTLKCYHRNKVRYSKLSSSPDLKHITIVRLQSPRACQNFLNKLLNT